MDPLTLGMLALSTGGGVANYFGQKGKKASLNMPQLNLPDYTPSQYDAPASGQLYSTLSNRVAGRDVGYSPEDLATMNSQAVDQSAKAGNDVMARTMAGRQNTGGVTTGGTNLTREKTAQYASGLQSQAMRDVAINNAVLKRQEQGAAISGEQGFLNSERANAQNIYEDKYQKAMGTYGADLATKQEADKVAAYNQARTDAANQDLYSMGTGAISGFMGRKYPQTKTSNTNPYAYGYGGFNTNAGMTTSGNAGMNIGQLLALLQGGK
jgi:hypothetical protein